MMVVPPTGACLVDDGYTTNGSINCVTAPVAAVGDLLPLFGNSGGWNYVRRISHLVGVGVRLTVAH